MFLTIIREAAITLLTGLPITGARVFDQMPYPLVREQLPCIVISASAPDVIAQTVDVPVTLRADVSITVEAYVEANAGGVTQLDDIAASVIATLSSVLTAGAKDLPVNLVAIDTPEMSSEGERVIGRRQISFAVEQVFFLASDPDTFI
jgi:hypothetical protein